MSAGMIKSLLLASGLMYPLAGLEAASLQSTSRVKPPRTAQHDKWAGSFNYSLGSDLADQRRPRLYNHALSGHANYNLSPHWSASTELGIKTVSIDGQIQKGQEQSYSETLSPTSVFLLNYQQQIQPRSQISFSLHGEPFWDEASRLEGYKGLVGGGGSLQFNFFKNSLRLANAVDASSLINTFHTGSDLKANPDYFLTYALLSSVTFLKSFSLSYKFGLKTTRYLDNYWGYNYQNVIALSKKWRNMGLALTYSNGGFTDDGSVSLWYLDQYRRLLGFNLNFGF